MARGSQPRHMLTKNVTSGLPEWQSLCVLANDIVQCLIDAGKLE
jgi:hypothetical protein